MFWGALAVRRDGSVMVPTDKGLAIRREGAWSVIDEQRGLRAAMTSAVVPNRRIFPVAGSIRATLPGFTTAHTAPSEVSPSQRTLSPPKPSFLVQVRGVPRPSSRAKPIEVPTQRRTGSPAPLRTAVSSTTWTGCGLPRPAASSATTGRLLPDASAASINRHPSSTRRGLSRKTNRGPCGSPTPTGCGA
jgi:hypothetical protein